MKRPEQENSNITLGRGQHMNGNFIHQNNAGIYFSLYKTVHTKLLNIKDRKLPNEHNYQHAGISVVGISIVGSLMLDSTLVCISSRYGCNATQYIILQNPMKI